MKPSLDAIKNYLGCDINVMDPLEGSVPSSATTKLGGDNEKDSFLLLRQFWELSTFINGQFNFAT